jgi:hypothetical protein
MVSLTSLCSVPPGTITFTFLPAVTCTGRRLAINYRVPPSVHVSRVSCNYRFFIIVTLLDFTQNELKSLQLQELETEITVTRLYNRSSALTVQTWRYYAFLKFEQYFVREIIFKYSWRSMYSQIFIIIIFFNCNWAYARWQCYKNWTYIQKRTYIARKQNIHLTTKQHVHLTEKTAYLTKFPSTVQVQRTEYKVQ